MNKIKRGLALILCTAIAVGSISSLTTEAYWDDRFGGNMTDLHTPPEGYEEFKESELYQNYSEYFDLTPYVYRSIENRTFFAAYYYFEFSKVDLITETDDWKEIYDKYSEELAMDVAKDLGDTIRIMDYAHYSEAESDDSFIAYLEERNNKIEEKYDILMEMCTEMYKAGCIESAEYTPFKGISIPMVTDGFAVSDYTGSLEELEAVVLEVNEEIAVRETTIDNRFIVSFGYDNASAEDFFAAADAIEMLEGDHTVEIDIIVNEESSEYAAPVLGGVTIDLLAPIKEIESCDINQSGAPDLDDASLLLTHYANTAAGIAAASEADTSSYDVNGDGTVDLDDALKIVTVYAELAAGLR